MTQTNETSSTEADDPRIDNLLEQARSAAEQAIEFARLAQEQAKLARDLNAQARLLSGGRLEISAAELQQIQAQIHSTATTSANVFVEPAANEPAVHVAASSPLQALAGDSSQPAPQNFVAAKTANGIGEPLAYSAAQTAALGSATAPATTTRSRSAKKSRRKRNHVRDRIEQQRRTQQPVQTLSRRDVRVKVRKRDLKPQIRDEDLSVFVATNWRSLMFSGGALCLVMLSMGLIFFEIRTENVLNTVMASFGEIQADVEEELPTEIPMEDEGEQQDEEVPEEPEPEEVVQATDNEREPTEPEMTDQPELESTVTESAVVESETTTSESDVDAETISVLTTEGSRSESARAALLKKYGGTAASESAVQHALEWFARHQMQNGAWNFQVVGQCSGAGSVNNAMGATSYVLLSFLGAGQTHREGKFKRQVSAGLNFLLRTARALPEGADLRGPNCESHHNFYVQGAAAMVLCEAYAMTKDRKLRNPAQAAINLICAAQDPRGGGWRYEPREPGTTSVTGLQIMALKSAKMAGLQVPPFVAKRAELFLNSVRSDGNSGRYGYTADKPRFTISTTSIALLSRMYLGWDRTHAELANGVAILDERGPQKNLYYNYYATQVMHQWGGDEWPRWNDQMREQLVRTQIVTDGPEHGSWSPWDRGQSSDSGGRLFATCLATMTLEVYYRYLPIYDELGKKIAEQSQTPTKRRSRSRAANKESTSENQDEK